MRNSRCIFQCILLCLLALLMIVSLVACKKPETPPDSDVDPNPTPVDGRYNPHAEARVEGADSIVLREYSRVQGTLIDPDSSGSAAGLQEYINTYMTEYDAVKMDGTVSTFQISKIYAESIQLNTEAMMAYVGSAGDLDLYAITDPMADPKGDGTSWSEEICFPKYKATLVSALLQPEINRFETAVWPDRCFTPVSSEYRTLQLACYEAINEMSGKAVTLSAGTPGITYLLSDSLSYQNGPADWSLSSRDGYYGVNAPLTLDGIPLKIRSLEQISSAEDLKDVSVLLLSWDCQKPLNEECVDAIADWILAGGTALYVGGHDKFVEVESEWWSAATSPLQALFDKLGLNITVTNPALSSTTLTWLGGSAYDAFAELSLSSAYSAFYTGFEGADAKAILKAGDTVLGIDQSAGKGHIVAIGLPSAMFAKTDGGADAMQQLVAYACNTHSDYTYEATTLMWTKRGRIIAAHSYTDGNVLTGKFINLFDPNLTVMDYVVINEGEDVLLCDVSDMDLSVPRILYSGGAHMYDPLETADRTLFRIIGPLNTRVATRIACVDGKYPVSLKATDGAGNELRVSTSWDNATGTLLVMVDGRTGGAEIEILWGDALMADTKLPTRELFSVPTNLENLDAPWIVRATAGVNGGMRYADKQTEVVYKIDLTAFTDPTIGVHVFQNYLISYSYDDVEWIVLADYSATEGYNGTLTTGGNNTVIQLDGSILNGHDEIYIRIADCNPEDGWGGSITKIEVSYLREENEPAFELKPYQGDWSQGQWIPATKFSVSNARMEGDHMSYTIKGSHATYAAIELGTSGDTEYTLHVMAGAPNNTASTSGAMEIRLNDPQGTLLGTLEFSPTEDWADYQAFEATLNFPSAPEGPQTICLVFKPNATYLFNYTQIAITEFGAPAP